ncbi:hypothetical protein FACS189472_10960 [Alphaproteobacteria bacterium]|nr:hypothetical protein FACS189472_10960 [Alphaproteobacteria bacterium]
MKKLILSFVIFWNLTCWGRNASTEEQASVVAKDSAAENAGNGASSGNNDSAEEHASVVVEDIAEETAGDDANLFNRLGFGLGVGFTLDKDSASNLHSGANGSKSIRNLMGTMYLASGRVISNTPVYLGGELNLALSRSKNTSLKIKESDVKINHNGLSPFGGLVLGYVNENTLYSVKLGVSNVRVKMEYKTKGVDGGADIDSKLSVSKLAPTFGFVVEKMLGKYSTRLDLVYVFATKSTDSAYELKQKGALRATIGLLYNVH